MKNMKTNDNALMRMLHRAWKRSPVKKLTALAVMIIITVSSVTTSWRSPAASRCTTTTKFIPAA